MVGEIAAEAAMSRPSEATATAWVTPSAVRAKSEMSQARFWCAEVTGCSCLASARATPARKPLSMEETCVRRAGGGASSGARIRAGRVTRADTPPPGVSGEQDLDAEAAGEAADDVMAEVAGGSDEEGFLPGDAGVGAGQALGGHAHAAPQPWTSTG
jgi:hypothetical protein